MLGFNAIIILFVILSFVSLILFYISRKSFVKFEIGKLITIILLFIIYGFTIGIFSFWGCYIPFYSLPFYYNCNYEGFIMTIFSHLSISYLFGSLFYYKVIKDNQHKILNTVWVIVLTIITVIISVEAIKIFTFY